MIQVKLEGAWNFRDLGGYQTVDGRTVKRGLLYRSDELSKLTKADVAKLEELGIRTIIDYRGERERVDNEDLVPSGARVVYLDPQADVAALASSEHADAFLSHDMTALTAERAKFMMVEQNRQFPLAETSKAAYRAMFDIVLDPRNCAVVQHCRGGKDRTGWGAALILLLLGIDRETVIEDYLLTNVCKREKNERSLAELREKTGNDDLVQAVRYLKEANRVFIETAFSSMEEHYGDVFRFASEALGVGVSEVERLRELYLG